MDLTPELLQSAWERVRENDGCAGVDGVTVARFEHQALTALPELCLQALSGQYTALPLRKILIEKKPGSKTTRTLLVPCVRDRVLQTAIARILSRSFEEEFLEASFAYRPGRGVDRAVARILQLRDRGWTFVVDADIQSYFDNISHSRLLHMLQQHPEVDAAIFPLLRQWVKGQIWDGHELKPIRRGISQGSPISPLLSNYFLAPLDTALESGGNRLIRYSDDFVILCQSQQAAETALTQTAEILGSSGLQLNLDKTRLTTFDQGFRFLGVQFRNAEAMIPWKAKSASGRLVFLAHFMPPRLLTRFRAAARHQPPPTPKKSPPQKSQPSLPTSTDMPYLYITRQGAILRKSGERFLVEHDGQILLDQPYHHLDQILVFGNVQITSQAMAEALDHNISLSLFTRHGRFRGALNPPPGKNVELRLHQYAARNDTARSLSLARATVRHKLLNSTTTLLRYENRDRQSDLTAEARRQIAAAIDNLDPATSHDEIQGLEGASAKAYFAALMLFNRSPFQWEGRSKHPPKDPLNALLSLSYTLLMHELSALAEAHGLDPAIGFLHEIDGARPSLSLDLMEPFRSPIADRFVLTTLNRHQFDNGDFEPDPHQPSVHLKPASLRRFFEEYERWMVTGSVPKPGGGMFTFRDLLRLEVRNFSKSLTDGAAWLPFSFSPSEETAT